MANKIEQFSRLINHRVTGQGITFTNPTSNDHTDETWSDTDLYIGEIGINVTDDTIFMRTNNGIVQISTSTASGGTASVGLWIINGSNELQIGSTYTPGAIVKGSGYFTDLGSSSLRFKDLFLGGSSDGLTTINVNNGFTLRDASNFLLTTTSGGSNIAPVIFGATSSTGGKQLPLHLNTQTCNIDGFGGERVIIGSQLSDIKSSSFRTVILGGQEVTLATASTNVVYCGLGQGREYDYNNSLAVGGKFVIKGVDDDGSGYYDRSEIIKGQERLITSNALTTPIFTHPWFNVGCGEVFSGKFWLTGVNVVGPSEVYSAELFVNVAYDGLPHIIGDPIINEVNTLDPSVEFTVALNGNDGFDINVKGVATKTVRWLLSYEYHRIINIC
jgi:hypothetical protein